MSYDDEFATLEISEAELANMTFANADAKMETMDAIGLASHCYIVGKHPGAMNRERLTEELAKISMEVVFVDSKEYTIEIFGGGGQSVCAAINAPKEMIALLLTKKETPSLMFLDPAVEHEALAGSVFGKLNVLIVASAPLGYDVANTEHRKYFATTVLDYILSKLPSYAQAMRVNHSGVFPPYDG